MDKLVAEVGGRPLASTGMKTFAEKHRLRVSRDDCGDEIIRGSRGHLYFADNDLCLMVTNGKPANRSKWAALGGKLWMGDISPDPKTGKNVQDVRVAGIPLQNARLAIQMVRARAKRVLSDAQKAALVKAQALSPLHAQRQLRAVESFGGRSDEVQGQSGCGARNDPPGL